MLLGLPLILVVECKGLTQEKLSKSIKLNLENEEAPVYIDEDSLKGLSANGLGIVSNLKNWIEALIKGFEGMGDVAMRISSIPEKATECTKNSPGEFAELPIMEKAQMIKSVATKVSKIKDKCEQITEEMKKLKNDIEDAKECMSQLQHDF